MTEFRLIERKVRRKLQSIAETVFAVRAPIAPWRMKTGLRYLDGGIPTPDDSWRVIAPWQIRSFKLRV